ncbi:type II toxin-antitoxin system VapC family toxin [Mesorhizobium sp. CO1-1-11]|uniref:type II toxin-antitoxin system VapC family toxin n=1 Tax=Mesorhizobium sp. CO1-1-11 TaxID=2876636 RepID=UPI001CCF8119|nr:type II toxin-antitoxin system VapC family toxin [Mesorhizobium sp. CO1-1-11]MBZ9724669.1 type II toxin-antitoxin system VapC family toxin [Mesorhizobium sp. CO1-1-11]
MRRAGAAAADIHPNDTDRPASSRLLKWTNSTDGLGFEVVVTPASARRIAEAYARWGRGSHPAALSFGDCFSYEVAKEHACRLLYVGADFSKTDIEGVLST